MPKNLSDLPSMSWTTSAATPIVWRSPMSGFSQPHNGEVTFSFSQRLIRLRRNRDRKDQDRKKTMTLNAPIHSPLLAPRDPQRLRACASLRFLGHRSKSHLAKCRQLLNLGPMVPKLASKSVHELMLQLTGIDH